MELLERRIEAYLQAKMPEARDVVVSNLYRIPGGASRETWLLDAAWSDNGSTVARGFVMRRDPPAGVMYTDRSVEYHILKALGQTDVPVPRVYWLEMDSKWLDQPFFVMEKVDGQAPRFFLDDPEMKAKIGRQWAHILGRQHVVDVEKVGLTAIKPSGPFWGVPRNAQECALGSIAYWQGVLQAEELEPQPVIVEAIHWLRRNAPKDVPRISLIHGDPHMGNGLCKDGQILAIVDWELGHLGDPMEDFGWIGRNTLISIDEFVSIYEASSGLKVNEERWHYWEVFAYTKRLVIVHTGARPFVDGRAYNPILANLALSGYTRFLSELVRLLGL